MTGENFKRINRNPNQHLKDELEKAKERFTLYAHCGNSEASENLIKSLGEKWNWDTLHRLEVAVTRLKHCRKYPHSASSHETVRVHCRRQNSVYRQRICRLNGFRSLSRQTTPVSYSKCI